MKDKLFLWGQKLIEQGAWFFAPFSWVWGLISYFKNLFYDLRWLPVSAAPCTVISVGNIVAGGTGKTPLVLLLAQTFAHKKVAILSRGYGAFADEAALLARRLPKVKVYIGKDRVTSARRAVAEGANLLILDDGFQYRKLARDFDLVLLDGEDPFGKGHYLPWGYLRDSPERLSLADLVLVNGKDVVFRVKRVLDLKGHEIGSIKDWKVALFSGIAKPGKFKKTVVDLGAEVMAEKIFADHALISKAQLKELGKEAKEMGAKALICTEKDFVKLPSVPLPLPLLFLEMELEISPDHSPWQKLIAKIEQKIDNYSSL